MNALIIFLASFGDRALMADMVFSAKLDWPTGEIRGIVDNAGYADKSGMGKRYVQLPFVYDLDDLAATNSETALHVFFCKEAVKICDELLKRANEDVKK